VGDWAGERGGDEAVAEVVRVHVEAFNAHGTRRLLDTLTEDVEWATGRDVIRGRAALVEVFDDGLWELAPRLVVRTLVVQGDVAAAELVEALVVDGERRRFAIATFFVIEGGLIRSVKVYREGSADIE
jgi:ketosteroid isomerase-like protein